MTKLPGAVRFDAGGVLISTEFLETRMTKFTLSRACIREATGWRYHRVRKLIEQPYRLESNSDPSGPKGGGQTERFRLGDVIARCRDKCSFDELTMTPKLIAADAAYRKDKEQ